MPRWSEPGRLHRVSYLGSYLSIPQANKTLQLLAIESLATYASLCSYFLVLAPNAVHVDTLKQCDTRTYSRRGWW